MNASGLILAALTICVPSSRLTRERRGLILADFRDAGARISADVSWLPAFNVRHPEASVASVVRSA